MTLLETIKEKLAALWNQSAHPAVEQAQDAIEKLPAEVEDSPELVALHDHLSKILNEGNRPLDSQHASDLVHLTHAVSVEPPPSPETQHSESPTPPPPIEGMSPSAPAPSTSAP